MADISAQVAQRASGYKILEFLDGMKACREGIRHQMGMSESYNAGYSTQYELEQIEAEICKR